ncbi:MAG: J domain-containing protein [Verrucomicrobiota bacterium]
MEDDYFDILGLPRRLDLAEGDVDREFKQRSKVSHPDAGGDSQSFHLLATARDNLIDPCARLSHWISLESGSGKRADMTIPSFVADLFQKVGSALQESDGFLKAFDAATTHLAKALLTKKATTIQAGLLALNGEIRRETQKLREELGGIQETHAKEPEEALNKARQIETAWRYLGNWGNKVQAQLGKHLEGTPMEAP